MAWFMFFMDTLGIVGGIVSIVTNFMQIRQLRNERRVNAAAYKIQRAYSKHRSTRLQVGSVTLELSYREEPEPQPPAACCSPAAEPAKEQEEEKHSARWPCLLN
jgi:uncharacterized membrane protein YcjF (UPF0283 family)